MLNQKTIELQKQFENLIMQSGCDASFASVTACVDLTEFTIREICQAYAKAVCYAASAHIENCYDTPDSECNGERGEHLKVEHYVKWMSHALSNPLLQV